MSYLRHEKTKALHVTYTAIVHNFWWIWSFFHITFLFFKFWMTAVYMTMYNTRWYIQMYNLIVVHCIFSYPFTLHIKKNSSKKKMLNLDSLRSLFSWLLMLKEFSYLFYTWCIAGLSFKRAIFPTATEIAK